MRVIECNECGATVSAANDDELRSALSKHMASDHSDVDWNDERAAELVAGDAYEAMDS